MNKIRPNEKMLETKAKELGITCLVTRNYIDFSCNGKATKLERFLLWLKDFNFEIGKAKIVSEGKHHYMLIDK